MIEPLTEVLADYFHFRGLKGALLLQLDRPRKRAMHLIRQSLWLAHPWKPITSARSSMLWLAGNRFVERLCKSQNDEQGIKVADIACLRAVLEACKLGVVIW